jgi:hypothetical protein
VSLDLVAQGVLRSKGNAVLAVIARRVGVAGKALADVKGCAHSKRETLLLD